MLGHDFNHRLILKILGSLLLVESVFIASAIIVSFYYNEPNVAGVMAISSGICVVTGLISFFLGETRNPNLVNAKVLLSWYLHGCCFQLSE